MDLNFIRRIFDTVFMRRFLFTRCGCRVYHAERLPSSGPTIFMANHASLGDAVVIQLLYPGSMLKHIRPSGARDYFKQHWLAYWAARDIMRMCFLDRGSGVLAKQGRDVFVEFRKPLERGNMIIYFPQGTRKEGAPFLPGAYHLARAFPSVPVIPILLTGTRGMFPPGECWPRPHPVSVYIGERFDFHDGESAREYAKRLEEYVHALERE